MKKSILILILAGLLTSCMPVENSQESSEISTAQEVTEASESEEISESEEYSEIETQPSTECEISTTEATVTTAEIQSETICTTTAITDVQKEKSQCDPTESRQEKATDDPTDHTESNIENALEESSRSCPLENSRSKENPNCLPGSPGETTEVTVTELEKYEEETEPPMCELSDYEKAAEIYEYMTVNGSGTCVQYAYQTYEMCQEYSLECYFAWTENRLYGHVANVVRIDGVWYVLDTQAGSFLTENMCEFTEIVDANERYIASADIISSVRYE